MTGVWPMVGRGEELAATLERLRAGVGAVVVGEAGLGKTMLAREVQRRLDAEGWRTMLVLCGGRLDVPLAGASELVGGADAVGRAGVVSGTAGASGIGGAAGAGAGGAGGGRRTLLVVDDAYLLDKDSAELLWRLAGSGATQVVATIRSGVKVPDRVTRLWTGGVCDRVELRPLAEADVHSLLERVLGGDVEDRLPRLLVQRARGNALLLRELVRSGLASGAIVRSHHVWRLAGELPVGGGAAELIRAAVGELSAQQLRAAQLLALGEPLRLGLAHRIVEPRVLEALEDKRIVAVQNTADGPVLTSAHPLYGEVIRADLAPLRSRRLRLELLDGLRRDESSTPHDVLRSALWRLELQQPTEPAELLVAARVARSISAATAEVLARAALDAASTPPASGAAQEPGTPQPPAARAVEAVVLLAEILLMQGRVAEADQLLDGIDCAALSEDERQGVIHARALGRTRLGAAAEAVALLAGAAPSGATPVQLQGLYAQALMLDGRIDAAMTVARPLYADVAADPASRIMGASTLIAGRAYAGGDDEPDPIVRTSLALADATRAAAPHGVASVLVMAVFAQSVEGHLTEAEELGHQMYDRALGDDNEWMRPRGASGLGVAALMRGLPRTATRYFRITVASLNEYDGLYLRYNLSYLARAAALAGFVSEARAALRPPADAPRLPIFQADWELAEAAVLAAEGNLTLAANHALYAARKAASMGQWVLTMLLGHDAVRYGAAPPAAGLVSAAAEHVRGPLPSCLSEHAHARAAADPDRLARVSQRFEQVGAILYAAEAGYAAARAYRTIGDGRSAAAQVVRATSLHARCEQALIPWVSGFQSNPALTRREQQVSLLAAAGQPDQAIAAALGVSTRTVNTHLARVYAKLDINGRHELPVALAQDGPALAPLVADGVVEDTFLSRTAIASGQ